MEWQRPEFLYLILPLGVAWLGLALYSRRRRRRAAHEFVAQQMSSRILPADSRARFWMKLLLREAALVAGLVALAGPRFGTQFEEVIPRGSDLYVLIDVSRSMLAEDVPPSRLGRAKADVAALVNRLEGERVGLIAFAGQAVVKCPLTVDYDAFRRALDELDTGSAPRGGTAIGDAIRKALEVFHSRAERDQAILLITDGDDQQSYPLEAAAVAAERHVTIFTIGLGDAEHGARVPQGAASHSYLEYQGQQVWSKLDSSLLKDIALKTSGVYVPVGTRAYDLGELYSGYLHGRRGSDEASHKRIRRSEQFQIFLAIALVALLADLFIRPYRLAKRQPGDGLAAEMPKPRMRTVPLAAVLVLFATLASTTRADDPAGTVREGLKFYRADEFDKARDKFAEARLEYDKQDAAKAAIAAFDEACASHRKGDVEHAREWYLKAGLAHDKRLAAAAHFNLGTLAAEEGRRLAGERPEDVAPDKRQEILDQLKGAVASFRHSLELQPDNSQARRDIELLRMWIKYYSDKWHERDRQKRRQETNLVAFLEFLIEAQRALRESVKTLPAAASADSFAELKRLQDELHDEIAPLKEKIRDDLAPQQPAAASGPPANTAEIEQGIALLQTWADAAGEKMSAAAGHLEARSAAPAADDQQSAIDELEKIWEAVIPFHALLARDLADQTQIARSLEPGASSDSKSTDDKPDDINDPHPGRDGAPPDVPLGEGRRDGEPQPSPDVSASAGPPSIATEDDTAQLADAEERTRRRTQLLKLKAEGELERLKRSPSADAPPALSEEKTTKSEEDDGSDADAAQPKPVDPEEIKAGYEKAIKLAPKAVEQMEAALKSLKQKDRQSAYPPAEEARKILEEILKSQPKQEPPEQKQKDQDKNNDEQNQPKQDDEKKDQQNQDQQKKDEEQKKQQEQNKSDQKKQDQKRPQPQVSRDQIEEALRKVRERQQEKHERDRKLKARVSGKPPVEKDW